MNIQDILTDNSLAFSIQDVDSIFEYVMFMQKLCEELSYQMEIEQPEVYEHEDETGTYIIVDIETKKEALNFVDLFIAATYESDIELDIDHLQLFTNVNFVYQRYTNAKHERLENIVAGLFEDTLTLDKRVDELDTISVFNNLSTINKTVGILAKGLESVGVSVIQDINVHSKPTIH